jgi:hypothetical protein
MSVATLMLPTSSSSSSPIELTPKNSLNRILSVEHNENDAIVNAILMNMRRQQQIALADKLPSLRSNSNIRSINANAQVCASTLHSVFIYVM